MNTLSELFSRAVFIAQVVLVMGLGLAFKAGILYFIFF